MPNPVVHFELIGSDAESTGEFYSQLFGWKTQSVPEMGYVTVDTFAGSGINGGFAKTEDAPSTRFYAEVADLQATLDKAEALGGKTVTPPTVIPNIVSFALFSDVDGNVIGIVQSDSDSEGPGVSSGSNPPVTWFEVLGKDAEALNKFYSELFGWKIKSSESTEVPYGEVDTETGRGIPGGIGQGPNGESQVTMYVKVDDLKRYLTKAESLGAKTVLEPLKVGTSTTIAAFKDPQDRIFGIYTEGAA